MAHVQGFGLNITNSSLLVLNLQNSTLGDTLLEGAALRDFAKPFYPFPHSDTAFEEK